MNASGCSLGRGGGIVVLSVERWFTSRSDSCFMLGLA